MSDVPREEWKGFPKDLGKFSDHYLYGGAKDWLSIPSSIMKEIFADTNYWIAILNEADALHEKAKEVSLEQASSSFILTSHLVLGELIEYFSR